MEIKIHVYGVVDRYRLEKLFETKCMLNETDLKVESK